MKSLVNDTITELRRTVWLINKPSVKLDEWLVKLREYYKKIEKVRVDVKGLDNEEYILSSKEATALFRIIQEVVNNSLKYAESDSIVVTFRSNVIGMQICIEDNGKGFDMEAISRGFGLDNMQQHAQEIGGRIQIDSAVGRGTRVVVEMVD